VSPAEPPPRPVSQPSPLPSHPPAQSCQRYWTAGGTLRNVAPGAGRRKSKAAGPEEEALTGHVRPREASADGSGTDVEHAEAPVPPRATRSRSDRPAPSAAPPAQSVPAGAPSVASLAAELARARAAYAAAAASAAALQAPGLPGAAHWLHPAAFFLGLPAFGPPSAAATEATHAPGRSSESGGSGGSALTLQPSTVQPCAPLWAPDPATAALWAHLAALAPRGFLPYAPPAPPRVGPPLARPKAVLASRGLPASLASLAGLEPEAGPLALEALPLKHNAAMLPSLAANPAALARSLALQTGGAESLAA